MYLSVRKAKLEFGTKREAVETLVQRCRLFLFKSVIRSVL